MTFDELMDCHEGNRAVYEKLLERFKANHVVPLFGAGMSKWAGYPGWAELLIELCGEDAELKTAVEAKLAAGDYEAAAELIERKETALPWMVAKRFTDTKLDEAKRPAYQRLFPKLFRGVLLTTNFERTIEPLYLADMDVVNPSDTFKEHRINKAVQEGNKPILLKLHGDVDSPKHIVLTTGGYNNAYGADADNPDLMKPMPQYLQQVLTNNAVLFIGASLRTDRTVKMLKGIYASKGLTHFAVMALPERKELQHWGVETIWFKAKTDEEYNAAYSALFERLAVDLGIGDEDDAAFLPVNELVGREREVGEVCEFWAAHQKPLAPLVWVSGPGGIGKTELCKAVCVKLAGAGRKAFVPMSDLTTLEGFYAKALKTLGHDPTKIKPDKLAEEAAKAMAGFCKGGVAYFDNAEDPWGRLDAAGKAAWAKWLDGIRADGVGVVVSSRESTPFAGRANCKDVDLQPLSDEAARRLFNAVWGRKPEDYEADDYNWLIKQLEGYPLAVVLVAQRTRVARRLNRKGWEKAAVEVALDGERHTSMEIALRASWEAIRGEPQAVALWGVFHQSVVPLSDKVLEGLFGGEFPDAGMEKLGSLGLAYRVDGGGAVRFDMLNPIKQQFRALFGDGADEAVKAARKRWLAYLRALLPRADQTAVPQEKRVPYKDECAAKRTVHGLLPQVWRLLDDLRDAGEADAAAALMGLAGNFFQHDVNSAATLEALRDFFQGKAERKRDIAIVNVLLGEVRRLRGENGAAEECYNVALVICREIGDRQEEANALNGLSHVRRVRGEYAAAEESYSAALAIYKEIGNRQGEANVFLGLGEVRVVRGECDNAERNYSAALAICREIGDRQEEANALNGLGHVWRTWGKYGKAEEAYSAALAICREIGYRQSEANALWGLGKMQRMRGEYDKAEEFLRQAAVIFRDVRSRMGETNALLELGHVRRMRGEYDRAEKCYREALAICWEIEYRPGVVIMLWGIGLVLALQSKLDEAEETLENANRIAKEIKYLWGRGAVSLGLGEVWKRRRKWRDAEKHYATALAVFTKQRKSKDDMADTRIGLGEVYEAKGDTAAALREYEAALQISEEIGYKAGCETAREKVEELRG